MSNSKKRPAKSTRRPAKQDQNTTMIRNIGIAALVLVLVGIVYIVVSSQTPKTPAAAAVSGPTPAMAGTKQYASAPPMSIDKTKQYTATVKMAKGGEFTIQLYPDKAPLTVNSFVFLARNGFFDGVTFHRVLEGFMAQGGDPTGTGSGRPGLRVRQRRQRPELRQAGRGGHGQCRARHQRQPVLHHLWPHPAAERRLYHLWPGDQRHGRGQRHHPARPRAEPQLYRRCDRIRHHHREIEGR